MATQGSNPPPSKPQPRASASTQPITPSASGQAVNNAGQLRAITTSSLNLLAGTDSAPSFQSIQFVAPNTAFAVSAGKSGPGLMATTDGGSAWHAINAPAGVAGIDMTNAQAGWATACLSSGCLKPNALYRTTNGGQAWSPAPLPKPGDIIDSLDFATPQVGWLELAKQTGGLSAPVLYHTTDGGATWSSEPLPSTASGPWPAQIDFVTASLGWLLVSSQPGAGSQEKWLYQSDNGGKTWMEIASSQSKTLTIGGYSAAITFANASVGYISLARGPLLKTTDGGRHWVSINAAPFDPESFGPLTGLSFTGPSTGYTIVGGVAWRTTDGGKQWTPLYPALKPIGPVSFGSSTIGLAVGFNGNYNALLKTKNGGRSWEPVGSHVMQTAVMVNRQTVLGIGYTSTGADGLWISQDGGIRIQPVSMPSALYASSMAAVSASNVWLVGTSNGQNTLFHTKDGGEHWASQPLPFTAQGIAAPSPDNLWAAATSAQVSYLYHSTDGGAVWSQYHIPPVGNGGPLGVGFLNPQLGWFWTPDAIYVTHDGAKSWHVETGPKNLNIAGVDFISAREGWMTTAQGLYQTTNGGSTWTRE